MMGRGEEPRAVFRPITKRIAYHCLHVLYHIAATRRRIVSRSGWRRQVRQASPTALPSSSRVWSVIAGSRRQK
jgi:hypothetical protein